MQRRRTMTCSITARGTLHNITAACCLCCVCQCTDGSITDKPLLQLVCKFHATSEVTSSLPATGVSGVEHRLCLKASYGFGKDIRQRGTASLPPSLLYEWTDKGNAFCLQVVTVNDYLARRDSEWVGQVHRFLGLQVGLVQQGLDVRFLTQTSSDFPFLCSASLFCFNSFLYL